MSLPTRQGIISAVYIAISRGESIFFLQRANTGWRDGEWTFPAGHVDPGESVRQAAIRELKEEVGLEVLPEQLKLVRVISRRAEESTEDRLDFFFELSGTHKPVNAEPHKCSQVGWFSRSEINSRLIPPVQEFFDSLDDDEVYLEVY